GHDVVVVEGEPPGAELGEPADVRAHLQGWAGRRAELVLGLPSCGPQTEGEPVVTSRGGGSHQKSLLLRSSAVRHRTERLVSYRNYRLRARLSTECSGVQHRLPPARTRRQEAQVQSAHLREHNLSAILTPLAAASATATPTSRAGLTKRTRLTTPTVSKLVEELVGADLVAEGDPIAVGAGRPMVPLTPAHGTLL